MRLALVLAALICTTVGAASAAAAPAQPAYGKAGRWITDASGRAVVLNGWNMVSKLPPYEPEAIGFGADDARFLAANGFDVVRLGIIWKGLEPTPGVYNEAYLNSIERTYDLLTKNGIAVMLDFHQDMYNERFQGEGMPDWAVLGSAATEPAEPKAGFPANYLLMPALARAYDAFWNNQKAADGRPIWRAYADAWVHVVRRFKNKPRLLGYNLFNEPFPGTRPDCIKTADGCPDFDRDKLTPFHATVTKAIRAVDRKGLVWYAPLLTFDFTVKTGHGDLGPNVGFAFNGYCTPVELDPVFPYNAGRSCGEQAKITHDQAIDQAHRFGDAVFNTEWAATDDESMSEPYANSLEAHMISWTQWSYWNEDPSAKRPIEGLIHDISKPPTPKNVKREKLLLSARPHPAAVAGTPVSYRFDRKAKRFTFRYTTLKPGRKRRFKANSTTEIRIPRVQFARRYRVKVKGARVVSKAGAGKLRLRSCRGAKQVAVNLTAGTTSKRARRCPTAKNG